MNKDNMKTPQGNYITQGLFLEIHYPDTAIYTLKNEDFTYKGKVYPSLKRLYLEQEDVIEYDFATKYLCGWKHWNRIQKNQLIAPYIEEWRNELQLKLRSKAFKEILKRTKTEQGMVANKWIADKSWVKREAGRPSNLERKQEEAYRDKIMEEYGDDLLRIGD